MALSFSSYFGKDSLYKNQRTKSWIFFISFIILIVQGFQWWKGRNEGFRLYKIQSEIPYESRWDVIYSEKELRVAQEILHQKFYYLGHGFQCYAFESEDKQYVIKFFRYQRLRLPKHIEAIPDIPCFSSWKKKKIAILQHRKESLLSSFKTSWEYAKFETALIFMHLNKTQNLFSSVTLVDLSGNEYVIYPDNYQFMLQKKAQLLKPTITGHVKAGQLKKAEERINQVFSLLLHCAKRGVQDTDSALIRKDNLGFLGGRAIYIDGGKLLFNETLRSKDSFEKDLTRLKPFLHWLRHEHPELVTHYHYAKRRTVKEYNSFLQKLTNRKKVKKVKEVQL